MIGGFRYRAGGDPVSVEFVSRLGNNGVTAFAVGLPKGNRPAVEPETRTAALRLTVKCNVVRLFNGEQFGTAIPEFHASPPNCTAEPGQHESNLLIERYFG
jgi:hypothetical protein